jgi:hypothetical protein
MSEPGVKKYIVRLSMEERAALESIITTASMPPRRSSRPAFCSKLISPKLAKAGVMAG